MEAERPAVSGGQPDEAHLVLGYHTPAPEEAPRGTEILRGAVALVVALVCLSQAFLPVYLRLQIHSSGQFLVAALITLGSLAGLAAAVKSAWYYFTGAGRRQLPNRPPVIGWRLFAKRRR